MVIHRRIIYLFPYGATSYENIETLADDHAELGGIIDEGPMFIFYDQEPIYDNFNYTLFDYIEQNFKPPFVLVTTERNSIPVQKVIERYNWPAIDYFHHIFAASDWYRGYKFNEGILSLHERKIQKKFITFNRITGNSRIYRTLFIGELSKRKLLKFGDISFSKDCPVHGGYQKNLEYAVEKGLISKDYANSIKKEIDLLPYELRIDNKDDKFITNDSMTLGPLNALMESFVYIVTETCFWETKQHLTEKIFKPIVAKQPFILLGCANNLKYLKDYGFKTFSKWWDEDYDNISDPLERLDAVVNLIEDICRLDNTQLQELLQEMEEILEHNYNLFFSHDFVQNAWHEVKEKLESVIPPHQLLTQPKTQFLYDLYTALEKKLV